MASTQSTPVIPTGSIIRTPHSSVLVLKDGSLRALRIDDQTWSKGGERQWMPTWPSLNDFLREAIPAWWTIDFKYPSDWFTDAHKQHNERVKALPRADGTGRYTEQSQKIWDETYGARRQDFLDQIVAPVAARYGLHRAADYDTNEVCFGTLGSPAARMAEEQMLELEPDRTKWLDRMWVSTASAAADGKFFRMLYNRNQAYQRKKQAKLYKQQAEEAKRTAAVPLPTPQDIARVKQQAEEAGLYKAPAVKTPVPSLLMPLPVATAPAPVAPHQVSSKVKISRQLLDLLLATGIKKVPDELWATLVSSS